MTKLVRGTVSGPERVIVAGNQGVTCTVTHVVSQSPVRRSLVFSWVAIEGGKVVRK